jgi:hypothetical protein
MQRSGASESPKPGTPEQPSTKRQRMSNGTYNSSPGSAPNSEQPVFHTPEEKKRMEASEREAAAKGETKWYLSVQRAPKPTEQSPLRIISTGYGALDSGKGAQYSDSEDDEPQVTSAPGRMNFGMLRSGNKESGAQILTADHRNYRKTRDHQERALQNPNPRATKTKKTTRPAQKL